MLHGTALYHFIGVNAFQLISLEVDGLLCISWKDNTTAIYYNTVSVLFYGRLFRYKWNYGVCFVRSMQTGEGSKKDPRVYKILYHILII